MQNYFDTKCLPVLNFMLVYLIVKQPTNIYVNRQRNMCEFQPKMRGKISFYSQVMLMFKCIFRTYT